MKIHVVSETQFMVRGNGVHTAFVDHVNLLRKQNDLSVVVNQEGRGDLFHGHTYGLYYFLKGWRYKRRRVHTVHVIPDSIKGSLPAWPLFMPFVRWYLKRVFSFADVCVAISPAVEEAIRELGADTRIVRIYNPIPVETWRRTNENREKGRKMLGIGKDEFVVLGVGQLQARKGVEDFMDVAAAMPGSRFVWAGGRPFGALTEGIRRIDERIGQAPANIQFTGMLDLETMPLVYAAADVLLFTSYQENCPLAPIEAAACGMPVVFRDLQEYSKLYEHSYLKAASTDEFIALTKRLKDDLDFYAQGLIMSGYLVTQFDETRIREKMINLYKELADRIPYLQPLWS